MVTGGTGLIGNAVIPILIKKGYQVYILTRNKKKSKEKEFIYWNEKKGILDLKVLSKVDHIIHLSGSSIISKRWSEKRKKEIISSRVNTTYFLYDKINELNKIKLKSFISASAVGYYGTNTTFEEKKEEDKSGNCFTSNCCALWEKAANSFEKNSIRVVKLRIGIVVGNGTAISKTNNKLAKMRLLIGFGNGKQAFPWIHLQDIANLFVESVSNSTINGIYNTVSPERIDYNQFLNCIKKQNRSYLKTNIPSSILRFGMGERANILLYGNDINSEKIQQNFKYRLKYVDISKAISA